MSSSPSTPLSNGQTGQSSETGQSVHPARSFQATQRVTEAQFVHPARSVPAAQCSASGPFSATAPCGLVRSLMLTAGPAALAAVLVAGLLGVLGADIAPRTALFASARPDLLDQVLQAVLLAVPVLLLARLAARLPVPMVVLGAGYGLALWVLGAVAGVLVVDGSAPRALVALTYGAVLGSLVGRTVAARTPRDRPDRPGRLAGSDERVLS